MTEKATSTSKEAEPKAAPEAEPWEPLAVGTHADPNGGAPIGPDTEPADQPEPFGLAGATPEETQAAYDEAGAGAPEGKKAKGEPKGD
jgi:hypothetical protein